MIRSGRDYLQSLCDGRAVWVADAPVTDMLHDPHLEPAIALRARLYDLQHQPEQRATLVCRQDGQDIPVPAALPFSQADWWAKRRATDAMLDAAGGPVFRLGDDTPGEIWALADAQDELNAIDPQFGANITRHIARATQDDMFLVTGNSTPQGSLAMGETQSQLTVLRETDAGLVVSGAKFATAAAHANYAYIKPALSSLGDQAFSNQAVGFICNLSSPGLRFICRPSSQPAAACPDEVETLLIFDKVLIPWEDVIFYRHSQAARVLRATLHRYSAFAFMQRGLRLMDILIGTAALRLRQTGLDALQPVQDRLGTLAGFRESLNAHLTAAITLAERSPAGLLMPNQSLLYAGRQMMTGGMHQMVQITRELCGGQVALARNTAADADHNRLLAFADGLLNAAQASQRMNFLTFAQAPGFAQSAALYRNFDWDGPMALVRDMAGLSKDASDAPPRQMADSAVSRWFRQSHDGEPPPLSH